jgi:DNA helicase II / ATP-dependent DNA helicase PcrA
LNLFDAATDAAIARESESLNPEQRAAVEHLEGPILVLAGAGSGKTRVLTVRIARLVAEHGVPPERILAVTFTNKAAGEMRERVRRFLGREPVGMWMGTFHALGARFLRRHAELLGWDSTFTIFDAEESLREIKRIMDRNQLDPKRWKPQAIRSAMSDAKNQLVGPDAFVAQHAEGFDFFLRTVAKIYPAYQASLREQNAFDFDDLLVKPVELLGDHPRVLERYQERFAFVLVDEYQDTNHAQFRLLEMLAERHRNIMVVGDDDQSIYGWRGADIRNILGFEESYPGAHVVRWSETTARPETFSRPPTRSFAGTCSARRRRSGPSATKASAWCWSRPPTSATKRGGSSTRSRAAPRPMRRWPTGSSPFSTARTPSRGRSRTRSGGAACPTRSWGGCGSTSGARSRMCWPT